MGHIHDINVKRLCEYFKLDENAYKKVGLDTILLNKLNAENQATRVFFRQGVPEDYTDTSVEPAGFQSFEEAYHQLMSDLTDLCVESIGLIVEENDCTRNLYVTGGFAKNPIFKHLLANYYPDKKVYTSEIPNASSLGAALVLWKAIEPGWKHEIDLGLILSRP